jgi:hypothetical protein
MEEQREINEDIEQNKWDQEFDFVVLTLRKENKYIQKVHGWLKEQFLSLQNAQDEKSRQKWNLLMRESEIQEAYERFCNRKSWGLHFHELKNFIKKYDRLPSISESDASLYNWTRKQITYLKNGKFDKHVQEKYHRINLARKERLLELDLIKYYVNNPYNFPSDRWTKKFEDLKKFIEEKGVLPSEANKEWIENPGPKTKHEFLLARWLVVQMQALRERREWKVSEHKKEKLMSLKLVRDRYLENKYLKN